MRKNITAIILFCLGSIFIQTEAIGGVIRCSTVLACDANQTDYLMMVAQDIYNSTSIDNLAARRASYNEYNISIVDVENMTGYSFTCEGIYDFIKAVYDSKSAEHMGDGHLGFVLLIGDAYKYNGSTVMLPEYDGYGVYDEDQEASDYYYACLDGDDFADVMIGRLSVGNETELSNVVNKIIDYETIYASGDWRNSIFLINGNVEDNSESNTAFTDIVEDVIPAAYNVSYLYRYGTCTVPLPANCIYYKPDADEAHDTIVELINQGQWIVNYEGHGIKFGWQNPRLLDTADLNSNLTNVGKLPFILSISCETGYFDMQSSSVDCMAEQFVNHEGNGAVAFLASSRVTDFGAFGKVDKYIYEAIFDNYEYLIGEAVVEAKLRLSGVGGLKYRRQYNLFGDPALNLFPSLLIHYVSGNITQNTTWNRGLYYIIGNVTVNSGVTLTIEPGASIKFANDTRLAINGKLTAVGNDSEAIIFQSIKLGDNKDLWYGIVFNSGADNSSSIEYATIKNAKYGIYLYNGRKPVIRHNTIIYNKYGIYAYYSGSINITYNTISYNMYGIYAFIPGSFNITYNTIKYNDYGIDIAFANGGTVSYNTVAYNDVKGIYLYLGSLSTLSNNLVYSNGANSNHAGIYMNGGTPYMSHNHIDYNKNGVYLVCSADPTMIRNFVQRNWYWGLWLNHSDPVMNYYLDAKNDIYHNGRSDIGEIYLTNNSNPLLDYGHNDIVAYLFPTFWHIWINTETTWNTIYARYNWWGSTESSDFKFHPPVDGVEYDPWDRSPNTGGFAKMLATANGGPSRADYKRLFAAMDLEYQGKYQQAAAAYRQIIVEYGDNVISRRALSGLVTVTHLSDGDLRTLHLELEKIAQSFNATGFGHKAQTLALNCLELAGDYEQAIAGYQQLQSEKGEAGAMAALRAGEIVLYGTGDKTRAEGLFQYVLSAFPNSEAANLALLHLAEIPDLPESIGRYAPSPGAQPEEAENSEAEPNIFSLSQNYPNPGNPTTTISFTLPEASKVTLEIYNILGRKVRTLVQATKPAGSHTTAWDGRDESGKVVSSGIYLYHLKCHLPNSRPGSKADFVRVKKLLLIR